MYSLVARVIVSKKKKGRRGEREVAVGAPRARFRANAFSRLPLRPLRPLRKKRGGKGGSLRGQEVPLIPQHYLYQHIVSEKRKRYRTGQRQASLLYSGRRKKKKEKREKITCLLVRSTKLRIDGAHRKEKGRGREEKGSARRVQRFRYHPHDIGAAAPGPCHPPICRAAFGGKKRGRGGRRRRAGPTSTQAGKKKKRKAGYVPGASRACRVKKERGGERGKGTSQCPIKKKKKKKSARPTPSSSAKRGRGREKEREEKCLAETTSPNTKQKKKEGEMENTSPWVREVRDTR